MPRPRPIAVSVIILVAGALTCPLRADQRIEIDDGNVIVRGDFQNARIRFQEHGKGHVAFIGGSITEMNGYRPMVMQSLQQRFPDTQFAFTDAGISSTCSTTGAFRLQQHVLDKGPVDLFFVEFAVNDDQDAMHPTREAIRGLEGIIRRTRLHNPAADIVITYFVNPEMLAAIMRDETPRSIAAHEAVAEHYQVPAIRLAQQVADSISAGDLTWEVYGGTHPKPVGNRMAADMIDRLMQTAWQAAQEAARAKIKPHRLPPPLDPMSYFRGRLIDVTEATPAGNAAVKVPQWSEIAGSKRERFTKAELLCLEGLGAQCDLEFIGTAVGAYLVAGPDAAVVEASIDGADFQPVDLYHHFSKGLHYPRTVMFAADLPDGPHRLTLRIAAKQQGAERRTARILNFVAN